MFDFTELIVNQTGSIGLVQIAPPLLFSQLFTGSPQYYPGSTVQVQEILTIVTKLSDASLVDVDYNWFNPKLRLGTYQLIDQIGFTKNDVGDEGFLTNPVQKIIRYSNYTITANPNVLVAQHEQIALDNCNFYLQPEVYLFPGNPVPQPGFKIYDINPTFLGSITLSKAPLADTQFNQKISGIGLFLSPGVEGISINYKVGVINDIYTDYPSAEVPQCQFLSQPTCQQQFAAFLATPNGDVYDSLGACQAVPGGPCLPFNWVCPTDPTDIRQYWSHVVN